MFKYFSKLTITHTKFIGECYLQHANWEKFILRLQQEVYASLMTKPDITYLHNESEYFLC